MNALLFPHERACLDKLMGFIAEHGYAPTIREMGALLGTSAGKAHALIHRLQDKGYIVRRPWKRRAIELVPQGTVVEISADVDRLLSQFAAKTGLVKDRAADELLRQSLANV